MALESDFVFLFPEQSLGKTIINFLNRLFVYLMWCKVQEDIVIFFFQLQAISCQYMNILPIQPKQTDLVQMSEFRDLLKSLL